MDITHISAYARIVENLVGEFAELPRKILQDIQASHRSDMRLFFKEECTSAQIPVPSDDELPELLKALWDSFDL